MNGLRIPGTDRLTKTDGPATLVRVATLQEPQIRRRAVAVGGHDLVVLRIVRDERIGEARICSGGPCSFRPDGRTGRAFRLGSCR